MRSFALGTRQQPFTLSNCTWTPKRASNTCQNPYQLHASQSARCVKGRCRPQVVSALALAPQMVFNTVTLAVMPLYGMMIAFPKKQLTKSVVSSPLFFAAGSMLYLVALLTWSREGLLGNVWTACQQYFANMQVAHVAALFESPRVTALAWTHLLLLDLCVARHVYLDGLNRQITTAHSIVLCFMFGPTGLLSHMLTKQLTPSP